MTLDRAVLLFAGIMVLVSLALGTYVSPYWYLLTAFIAADGHLLLLATLHDMFTTFPIAPGLIETSGWQALANAGVMVFGFGLRLALPVIGRTW